MGNYSDYALPCHHWNPNGASFEVVFFKKVFLWRASLINGGGSAHGGGLSAPRPVSLRSKLDVVALELLPCVETSVTSVFLHVNKSDKCAKIYEVQRRSSGTNGTRVPLADSAGMEATMVRRGGD